MEPPAIVRDFALALGLPADSSLEAVIRGFEAAISFNRVLGLQFVAITSELAVVEFAMRDELIGHPQRRTLHGGVISASLDTVGGIAAMAALIERAATAAEVMGPLERFGTIDLRIDYLRPGTGERFRATAHPLRLGRTVAVTRMELADDDGSTVAVGTGTYIVG